MRVSRGSGLLRHSIISAVVAGFFMTFLGPLPASANVPVCSSVSVSPTNARTIGMVLTATATCSNSPTSFEYQWQVSATSTSSGFVDISGANEETFIITQDYFGTTAGQYFRVGVRGINSTGTGSFAYSTSLSRNVYFPETTLAGVRATSDYVDATGSSARFGNLAGIATDGSNLFVSDRAYDRIRKITPSGVVTTLAGSGVDGSSNGSFTNATFRDLRQMAYSAARNQLFVKDAQTIRVLDFATSQVHHMLHQETPASWSQSGTNVTITFAKDHWFYASNSVEVAGISAAVDGSRNIASRTATTITFAVGSSATVASTSLDGAGATVTGVMGNINSSDVSNWSSYYNAFQVSPDGNIYMARTNSGEAASNSKMMRFKHVSGFTYSLELVPAFSSLVCSISFESATVMYVNTCGSIAQHTTTDAWATSTASALASNNSPVLRTSGKYLFSGPKRLDLSASPITTKEVFGTAVYIEQMVELGDNIYWIDDGYYTNAIYVFENAVSGITPTTDVTAPSLASSTPSDGATGVGISANLVLNFSEAVSLGTGNITLYKASDPNSAIQQVAVSDTEVTISGSTVTVDWTTNLEPSTEYFVLIDASALQDASGNTYSGLLASSDLNFTTIGIPTISSSTPSDNSTNIANNSNIVLNFSRAVSGASGKNITILNTESNASIQIAADGANVTGSGTSQITINPASDLAIGTNYSILLEAGAFLDSEGLATAAITDPATLNFTTAKIPYAGLSIALDASISSSYGGTGSTWSDLSGSGNNLTLYNSPSFVNNGTDPKAFAFNGTSQYGDFGAAKTGLLDENKYTKLVWFKPQGFADRNNLFSSSGANGATNNAHAFWGGGNNGACTAGPGDNLASGHNGLWFTVVSSECLETEWQLGVVTFTSDAQDPNAGWRLYRNGILVGSSSDRTPIGNTTYETRIGSYSGGNFFEGQISQVYLYDRALTSSEINDIYEATSSYFGLNLNTVTFNPSGGTVDLASLRTNAGDGRVTLRTPTKANATFLGWYTDPTSGTRVGGGGDSYDPEGNDVTLYARWDNSYTVTYSAGTNATGAPASAGYLDSTGPLTLPTPTRADYVFEGWYSAATGGTKIGNAGASYTPSADVTLHGRWTQASLAGIPAADLSEVNSTTIQAGVASSNTHTIGSSSVAVNIPANAFSAGVVVRVYSVANHNRAAALLPNESDFVNSMVVAWTAPDTTVPVALSALTMVITDANIKSGAKVYSIVGDQSTLLATATQDGTVTISFTTDPLLTIANPVIAPAPAPSSGGGGGGSGGGGSGGSSAPVEPVATKVPSLFANQILEVVSGGKRTVELKGANLDLITAVSANGKDLVFSLLDSGALLVYVEPSTTGVLSLELTYKEGKLTQTITVREAVTSRVNAGTFRGVVALYAKGLIGKRFSAKVGKDWVIVDSLQADFVRLIERVGAGRQISVRIYVDRRLERTINLLTR